MFALLWQTEKTWISIYLNANNTTVKASQINMLGPILGLLDRISNIY